MGQEVVDLRRSQGLIQQTKRQNTNKYKVQAVTEIFTHYKNLKISISIFLKGKHKLKDQIQMRRIATNKTQFKSKEMQTLI
jgi:hypothetical protein